VCVRMFIRTVTLALLAGTCMEPGLGKRQHPFDGQVKVETVSVEESNEVVTATAPAPEIAPTADTASLVETASSTAAGWAGWAKHLVAGISTAILVKILCLAGNAMVHVSPFSQVRDWQGKGSTGDVDPSPYVSIGVGGWQWCTYGFAAWLISGNDRFLVLIYANCLGALCGSYYTLTFFRLCQNPEMWSKLKLYLMAVTCIVLLQSGVWLALPHQRALAIHSVAAATCAFLTSLSLLASVPTVVQSKDASVICGPLVLANFGGALVWTYWGFMVQDVAIISVNLFAALSSVTCLLLKVRFRPSSALEPEAVCEGKMGRSWGPLGRSGRFHQKFVFAPKEAAPTIEATAPAETDKVASAQ